MNRIDPSGLWAILPGYELSNGGMYGQGMLTMPGSPQPCKTACWDVASTTMPIFVPTYKDGFLYDDIAYRVPKTMDGPIITSWNEYDPIEASFRCMDNAIVVSVLRNEWRTIFTRKGKSQAFSHGGFYDFTVLMALGMGYDSGFVPYDVTFDASIDENWSTALAYYRFQNSLEREQLDLVKLWDDASESRDILQGVVGGVAFAAQASSGLQAFNRRNVTIIIQEHKGTKGLYRAIIETYSMWKSANSNAVFATTPFVSFHSGSWQEQGLPGYSLRRIK